MAELRLTLSTRIIMDNTERRRLKAPQLPIPTLTDAASAPAWRQTLVQTFVLLDYHNTLSQHSAPSGWKWSNSDAEEVTWEQQQTWAIELFLSTIAKEHYKNLANQKETVAAAWTRLNDKFKASQGEIAVYYRLPTLEAGFDSEQAESHLSLFEQRFILLAACGIKLTDDMRVGMFVGSLPPDWDADFLKQKRTWPMYRKRFEWMTAPHRLGKKKTDRTAANSEADTAPSTSTTDHPAAEKPEKVNQRPAWSEKRQHQEGHHEYSRPIRQPRPPPQSDGEASGSKMLRPQPSHSKLRKPSNGSLEQSHGEGLSSLGRRVSTSRSHPRPHAAHKSKAAAQPKQGAQSDASAPKFSQSNPFDILGDMDNASEAGSSTAAATTSNSAHRSRTSNRPGSSASSHAEAGPSRHHRKLSSSEGRSGRASNFDSLSAGMQDLSVEYCTHCHVSGHDVSRCYKRTWCSHCQIPGHHVSKCRRKAMGAPKRHRRKGEQREAIVEEEELDEDPEVLVEADHLSLINPTSLTEACDGEEGPFWIEAMELEKARLINNGTIEEGALPEGQRAGFTDWSYVRQIKRDYAKYRCRVHGIEEERGDVAGSIPTLRVILSYGASLGMRFRHLSIDMAVPLSEPTYVSAPNGAGVWKVNKTLRGMKGSGKAMDRALRESLLACDFKKCKEDGVFVLLSPQGRPRAIVFQQADDVLVASWTAGLKTIVPVIKTKIKEAGGAVDDLGDPALFLGIGVECFPHNCDVLLQQNHFVDHILAGVPELADVEDRVVPLAPGTLDELASAQPETEHPVDRKWWRKILNQLGWLARCTRPDIAFAVAYLSRFSNSTTLGAAHRSALLNLLAYLRARREFEFKLGNDEDTSEPHCARAYSHGFMAPALDVSHVGWALLLDGSTVDWASHKSSVAATGLEADLVAQGEAAHRLVWLNDLLTELGIVVSPYGLLFGDNCGVVNNQATLVEVFKRNKHVLTEYQFMLDLESKDRLRLHGCDDDQPAKMCSMPVVGAEFNRYRLMYGLERQLDISQVEMIKGKTDEEALHHLLWEDETDDDTHDEGVSHGDGEATTAPSVPASGEGQPSAPAA